MFSHLASRNRDVDDLDTMWFAKCEIELSNQEQQLKLICMTVFEHNPMGCGHILQMLQQRLRGEREREREREIERERKRAEKEGERERCLDN